VKVALKVLPIHVLREFLLLFLLVVGLVAFRRILPRLVLLDCCTSALIVRDDLSRLVEMESQIFRVVACTIVSLKVFSSSFLLFLLPLFRYIAICHLLGTLLLQQ
jgi:hypothetical protein